MKNLRVILVILTLVFVAGPSHSQIFKKLRERAEEAAKETILRKSEEKAAEKTGQAMDSLFEAPNKIGKRKKNKRKNKDGEEMSNEETVEDMMEDSQETGMDINSNFDFEPGTRVLFHDDFGPDRQGDFPSKWDTNGSGEIMEVDGDKWFRLKNASQFLPIINKNLPENYTIEFDLLTWGIDRHTNSQGKLTFIFTDTRGFQNGKTFSYFEISPCQFVPSPGYLAKFTNGQRDFFKAVGQDYRPLVNNAISKVSIAVNGPRVRLWLNQEKILDIPRFFSEGIMAFKMETHALRTDADKDLILIKDFKVAEAGQDYRSQLLTEGSISTNAILFESGSAKIKSGSTEIIEEIAQVLIDNPEVSIKIVGHTDADGTETSNQTLSKNRADSVKNYITQMGISTDRILTAGMGESQPIASNDSPEGKAQNRRVEFIKL